MRNTPQFVKLYFQSFPSTSYFDIFSFTNFPNHQLQIQILIYFSKRLSYFVVFSDSGINENEAGGEVGDDHDDSNIRDDDKKRRCLSRASETVYTEYGESRACVGNSRQRYIDLLQAFCPRCIR